MGCVLRALGGPMILLVRTYTQGVCGGVLGSRYSPAYGHKYCPDRQIRSSTGSELFNVMRHHASILWILVTRSCHTLGLPEIHPGARPARRWPPSTGYPSHVCCGRPSGFPGVEGRFFLNIACPEADFHEWKKSYKERLPPLSFYNASKEPRLSKPGTLFCSQPDMSHSNLCHTLPWRQRCHRARLFNRPHLLSISLPFSTDPPWVICCKRPLEAVQRQQEELTTKYGEEIGCGWLEKGPLCWKHETCCGSNKASRHLYNS